MTVLRHLCVTLAVLLTLGLLLGVGCATPGNDSESEPAETTEAVETGEAAETTEAVETGESAETTVATDAASVETDGRPVLMLGRSVMWGWFKHWGWDGAFESMPFQKDGYSLTYVELKEPPDIADSAKEHIERAPEGCPVFFKFCFIDFHGGEDSTFDDQKKWVEEVADKAAATGHPLIVGNALPKTAPETDADLVAEHRRFNEWLEGFASQREGGVWVYDFYAVLTDANGAIQKSFASASDDAHPNDKAYDALDPSLFDLLEEVTR